MILHVLADSRAILDDWDAEPSEVRGCTDAAEH